MMDDTNIYIFVDKKYIRYHIDYIDNEISVLNRIKMQLEHGLRYAESEEVASLCRRLIENCETLRRAMNNRQSVLNSIIEEFDIANRYASEQVSSIKFLLEKLET